MKKDAMGEEENGQCLCTLAMKQWMSAPAELVQLLVELLERHTGGWNICMNQDL